MWVVNALEKRRRPFFENNQKRYLWGYIKKSPKVDALRLFNKVTLKEALDFNCTQIYYTSFSLPRKFKNLNFNSFNI